MTEHNQDLDVPDPDERGEIVIPLVGETLQVGKKTVATGTVRLHIGVEEQTETVGIPLTRTRWEVQHVSINKVVAEAPLTRVEGATTVYPVMAERLVVTRELVLVEELRVTRIEDTKVSASEHLLRRQVVVEERSPIAR